MNGQVKNYSSKTLWVLVSQEEGMVAYPLAPGYQSPDDVDADGFQAVDNTPIDSYQGWIKIVDLSTTVVKDRAEQLTAECLFCGQVEDKEFGKVKFIDQENWGEPIK
ncbi:MAG: hypothetical protein ACFB4I_07880 [Cyanophyceae cyanobacterium]